jgi:GDPmannose 4,6-dehydratase
MEETGIDSATGQVLVEIDPRYFRPTEVELLVGDPGKAHQKLGWRHETSARELAREMVREDLEVMRSAPMLKSD